MTTSDMIRQLCQKENISISKLARMLNQSPQNFNKKLLRNTVSLEELNQIASLLNATFIQQFVCNDGTIINSNQ